MRAAVLLLATVLVYRNSLDVPFFFDDGPAILRNPTIHTLALGDALNPSTSAGSAAGRPLVNLSFALNYAWGGLEVRGYHVTNTALHALAVLALWGIVRRTLGLLQPPAAALPNTTDTPPTLSPLSPTAAPFAAPTAESIAFFSAALWAVHPLITESVVCVVQRTEVLGGLFYLLTLYAAIRAAQSTAPALRISWQTAAAASCFCGIASKEIVATAPIVVLLHDRTFFAGSFAAAWRARSRFYLALASSWIVLAWLMIGARQRGGTVGLDLGVSSWDYLLTQARALTIYLKLSFWPYPLIVDYGLSVARSLREVWWQGLLVILLLIATGWALRHRPRLGFLGAWFFIILAPSSSVVPLVTQTIAEHRMYLPLAALMVLLVVIVHRLAPPRWHLALGVLVLGAASLTWQRNNVYRDEHRLWSELVTAQPANPRAHVNLGYYYARQADWPQALQHNTTAVQLSPGYAEAHNGLGQALARLGRLEDARREFEIAQAQSPNDALINFNYGSTLAQLGRFAEGIERLQASLRTNPAQPDVHNNLGLAFSHLGRTDEAIQHFRAGLALAPDHAEAHGNLANAMFAAGDFAGAAEEYARALALKPDLPGAHQNLALTLVRQGRAADAVPHYERALAQSRGSATLHHQYAIALAAAGRVAAAIVQAEEALRLDPSHDAARQHLTHLRAR